MIESYKGILGAIALACFTAYLSFRHYQKVRKQNAVDKFTSTIISELKDLYPKGIFLSYGTEINNILKSKHTLLQAAVTEHSDYVKNKESFMAAWYKYTGSNDKDEKTKVNYSQYTITRHLGKGGDFSKTPENDFIRNIDNLLENAKKI